jgi:hypothetical protein
MAVCDGAAHQVKFFNPSGQQVGTIGKQNGAPGSQDAEFRWPTSACVVPDDVPVDSDPSDTDSEDEALSYELKKALAVPKGVIPEPIVYVPRSEREAKAAAARK